MADYSNNRAPRYIPRGNPQPQPRPQSQQDARAAGSDPLSELARLIGQTDPFADVQRPPRSERSPSRNDGWPGQPAAPSYSTGLPPLMPEYRDERPQPRHDDYAAPQPAPYPPQYQQPQQYPQPYPAQPQYPQQGYQDQHRYEEPHVAYDPAHHGYGTQTPQYGQHPADAAYYDNYGDPSPQDPYADPYGYQERRPRRRGGLVIAIALVSFAVVGTAGAYAYRTIFHGGPSGPPPLIKADTTPSKIVPAQTATDNNAGKQIYDRVGSAGGQGERVVSREEQPVDVRSADVASAGSSGPQTIAGVLNSQPPDGFPAASSRPTAAGQGEPHKVRTVTIRPDQQGTVPPAPAPRAAAPAAQSAPPRTQHVAAAPSGNAPLSLTPGASAAQQSTASTSRSSGGFMVQISAQKSEAEATAAFNAAKVKYSDLLGTYQVVLRKKQIPGKGTFYGAQVGPFATREDASGLCSHLKSAGGNCLVEKN